jgi:origin recognition complex subunit 1
MRDIAGVPGTGKTATVHAVVKELKRKAEDGVSVLSFFFYIQQGGGANNQELPPFSYVEINGLKIPSPQHAYTVLWEAVSGVKGCSSKTALRGLEGHFGRKTAGVRGPRGHTLYVLFPLILSTSIQMKCEIRS